MLTEAELFGDEYQENHCSHDVWNQNARISIRTHTDQQRNIHLGDDNDNGVWKRSKIRNENLGRDSEMGERKHQSDYFLLCYIVLCIMNRIWFPVASIPIGVIGTTQRSACASCESDCTIIATMQRIVSTNHLRFDFDYICRNFIVCLCGCVATGKRQWSGTLYECKGTLYPLTK